jgi:hypothetical protein
MHTIQYKGREYGVFALQRSNRRWDAYYEIRTGRATASRTHRYQVASLFGFESQSSAMQDAERNARADIDQGIGMGRGSAT